MWKPSGLSLVMLSLTLGCTLGDHPPLPPALPDDPVLWEPAPATKAGEVQGSPRLPTFAEDVPVQEQPVMTPTAAELQAFREKGSPKKGEKPEMVIAQANRKSTISPSTQGYNSGKNSIQRYPYIPGMIYDVYSSPTIRPRLSSHRANAWPRPQRSGRMPGMSIGWRWARTMRGRRWSSFVPSRPGMKGP